MDYIVQLNKEEINAIGGALTRAIRNYERPGFTEAENQIYRRKLRRAAQALDEAKEDGDPKTICQSDIYDLEAAQ